MQTKTVMAVSDATVRDPATGALRKVFAGQPIPPELVDAYEQEGGETNPSGEKRPIGATIAVETRVVYDPAMGIKRQVLGGQPIPPDLVDAYNAAGDAPAEPDPRETDLEPVDYSKLRKADLEKLVADRSIEVTGTGAGGKVKMEDMVAALEAADAGAGNPEPVDYATLSQEELEQQVADRGLEVTATGENGVVAADLIGALEADDAAKGGE